MLTKIYWLRVALGAVAGLVSTGLTIVTQTAQATFSQIVQHITDTSSLLNGITIALLVYIISYYALKAKFYNKVEKQSKIMTMGIGIYFISWAVFFILSYSILIA